MCIHIYIYKYTHKYRCIYIYIYTHTYIHTYIHTIFKYIVFIVVVVIIIARGIRKERGRSDARAQLRCAALGPFGQFCEVVVSLPSLRRQPKDRPRYVVFCCSGCVVFSRSPKPDPNLLQKGGG